MKRFTMWALLTLLVLGPAIIRIMENGPMIS